MPLRRSMLAATVALSLWASAARAEPEVSAPPVEAVVIAPRVVHMPEVAYPAGARGAAEVILLLIINVDGSVRSAQVQRGEEPFASAARKASSTWRFSPATRDGEAIAAKIRLRVSFTPAARSTPALPPAGESAPTPTPPKQRAPAVTEAPGSANDADGPIDVEVLGRQAALPPSVSSLSRAEVRQLPGAFGDPFRAIEILPGVTPIVSGLPFFYLRGAPPGNIGYFLDGVRVPYLFHVAAGPSVVHPAIVDRVDLYAGGYPARLGRFAGGVVSAETTEPRSDWRGEGSIRLVDAGALVEGGFADGRGTALLGGRYSYTAALFSLISPDVTLDYRDYQARISYELSDRDRVSLFAFGAYDLLTNTEESIRPDGSIQEFERVLFGSEFYRIDGRYDARLEGGGSLRAAVTWGFDRTRLDEARDRRNMLVGSRVLLNHPLSEKVTLRGGFNMQVDNYSTDSLIPPTLAPGSLESDSTESTFNNLFPPRSDTATAGWLDMVWKPNKTLEVTPGIRVDTYFSEGESATAVDPRLSVVAHIHDKVRVKHALGLANQPPSFVVPVPGLALASLRGGLQRSVQAASGVEVDLPAKITASVTGFSVAHLNMTDAIGAQQDIDGQASFPRSLGGTKGLEVYVRRSLNERMGGFISYTFSRSTRSIARERFLAAFDRPHVLHSAVAYDLGRKWRMGLRFSIYSGKPSVQDFEPGVVDLQPQERERDPAFYRLDFRVEKKWQILDTAWISFVAEMINATLNPEVIEGERIGPITIPSLGVEGGF